MKLVIRPDHYGESPRKWDNLGTIAHVHSRYNLGEERYSDEHRTRKFREENIILPVYLYDHSGITINTTGFSCPWDSGQVGIIYVSRERVRKEYGWKAISKKREERIKDQLRGEIETFDQYLTGDVYGFELLDDSGEEIDTCWGFYGYDWETNGIKDCIREEHLENLEVEHNFD